MFFRFRRHTQDATEPAHDEITIRHHLLLEEIAELRDLLHKNNIDADSVPRWYARENMILKNGKS